MENLTFEQTSRIEALRTAQYISPSIKNNDGTIGDYGHKDADVILNTAQKIYEWLIKETKSK